MTQDNGTLAALHQQDGPVPIELLLQALHDEDASVRAVAVRLLGERDDNAAMTALETALDDSDCHVRETAVFALGQLISPPVDLLIQAQHDEDSVVREAATSVLLDIQTESFTIRSLPPNEVLPARSHTHFAKVFDYTNKILQWVQDIDDSTVPGQRSRTNMRVLEIVVAVVLVLGLAGSWFALTYGVHTPTQDHTDTSLKGSVLYRQDEMTSAAFWTSNSKYVYIYDQHNTVIHFVNVATKRVVATIANPELVALRTTGKLATLTPDGLSVCTVDNTGSTLRIKVQSVLTNKIVFDASYPKIASTNIGIISRWSNDGTRIALSSDNSIITIVNVTTVQPLVVLKGATTPIRILEWSHYDRQLLATTANGTMQVWNTATGKRSFMVTIPFETVSSYLQAFSPDGKYVGIIPNYRSVQILDASTGKVVLTHHSTMSPQNASYQWIDSTHIVSNSTLGTSNEQHIQLWDIVSDRVTLSITLDADAGYSTSAINKYIVVQAPTPSTSQVWDTATGHIVATHTSSSAFLPTSSPNEHYFLTTSGRSDNKIDLWSGTTGKTIATYYGNDSIVVNAQWSPDGKYVFSLSTDGSTLNLVGAVLNMWRVPGN